MSAATHESFDHALVLVHSNTYKITALHFIYSPERKGKHICRSAIAAPKLHACCKKTTRKFQRTCYTSFRKLLLPAVDVALMLVLVLCSGFDFTELAHALAGARDASGRDEAQGMQRRAGLGRPAGRRRRDGGEVGSWPGSGRAGPGGCGRPE